MEIKQMDKEITTTLIQGIHEEKTSLFSISSYLMLWMLLVTGIIVFTFKHLGTQITLAIKNVSFKTTDSSEKIQEELNKAKSGSIFLFESGIHPQRVLYLQDKKEITLKGEEGTIFKNTGVILQIAKCQNIYIQNITFDASVEKSEEGILSVSGSTHLEFRHLTFSLSKVIGMTLINSDNILVKNCVLKELKKGMFLNKCKNVNLVENEIKDNTETGIEILESDEVTLNNNKIFGNVDGLLLKQARKNIFQSKTITNNSNKGIELKQCQEIQINENMFSENQDGLMIENTQLSITNNKFTKNIGRSISLSGEETNPIITGNTIKESSCGIQIQKNAISKTASKEKLKSENTFEKNTEDIK